MNYLIICQVGCDPLLRSLFFAFLALKKKKKSIIRQWKVIAMIIVYMYIWTQYISVYSTLKNVMWLNPF